MYVRSNERSRRLLGSGASRCNIAYGTTNLEWCRRHTLPGPKVTTTHLSRVSLISGTESGVQAPEGWQRAKLVLVLGAITALGPFTVDMYLSAFPFIANELSTSGELVQFTLTGSLLGFAVGQLIIGPLSDAFGRRVPLVAGSALHFGASLVCMIAPAIEILTAARIVQGFGAAAGTVFALAVVRDLFDGDSAAIVLSRLMLVMGVARTLLLPSAGCWYPQRRGIRSSWCLPYSERYRSSPDCGRCPKHCIPVRETDFVCARSERSTWALLRTRCSVGSFWCVGWGECRCSPTLPPRLSCCRANSVLAQGSSAFSSHVARQFSSFRLQ